MAWCPQALCLPPMGGPCVRWISSLAWDLAFGTGLPDQCLFAVHSWASCLVSFSLPVKWRFKKRVLYHRVVGDIKEGGTRQAWHTLFTLSSGVGSAPVTTGVIISVTAEAGTPWGTNGRPWIHDSGKTGDGPLLPLQSPVGVRCSGLLGVSEALPLLMPMLFGGRHLTRRRLAGSGYPQGWWRALCLRPPFLCVPGPDETVEFAK